jgi:hypothetical protein
LKRAASLKPSAPDDWNWFMEVFQSLQSQARGILPKEQEALRDLVPVDGSLIDVTLSMK